MASVKFAAGHEWERIMFRVIFHLDMDAFYASVEQRDHPSLKGKPVIVGSPPTQRGVVCAASYEARKFGVRSAMPSVTAGRLCPKGIFLRPRMEAYRAESREIMAVVQEFAGELIQQVSVDEAYLDVSAQYQAGTADESLERALPLARRNQGGHPPAAVNSPPPLASRRTNCSPSWPAISRNPTV